MRGDDLFPLADVPSRVRTAILREFNGRTPSIHEVKRVSEERWLAVPGVGPTILEIIRRAMQAQPQTTDPRSKITDDELLKRLELVQDELRLICEVLRIRLAHSKSPRSVPATLQPHP